MDLKNKNKVY